MTNFTSDFNRAAAAYSPDRVDALVWALTELLVEPMKGHYIFELYRRLAGGETIEQIAGMPQLENPPHGAKVGLLSLFNMGGRFRWAAGSDYLGRRNTYTVFFLLGIAIYASVPTIGRMDSITLFVAAFVVILSMYGGAGATNPGLFARYIRTHSRQRHPRPVIDRLGGGSARTGSGELYPSISDR
jgi:hypothetical protein